MCPRFAPMPLLPFIGERTRCIHFDGAVLVERSVDYCGMMRFEVEFIPGKPFPEHPPHGGAGGWSRGASDDHWQMFAEQMPLLPDAWRGRSL